MSLDAAAAAIGAARTHTPVRILASFFITPPLITVLCRRLSRTNIQETVGSGIVLRKRYSLNNYRPTKKQSQEFFTPFNEKTGGVSRWHCDHKTLYTWQFMSINQCL
jgi:hypothetical protein